MSRQPSPLDVADHDQLVRVATLAARIMATLRQPGRGRWSSEWELKSWITADGWTFTTSDVAMALTLLEAAKRIVRGEVAPNTPRPGRLGKGADIWHSMDGPEVNGDVPGDAVETALSPLRLWLKQCGRPLPSAQLHIRTSRTRIANIARYVHRNVSVYAFDLQKMITGNRRMSMDQLLDYVVSRDWLAVDGSRVSPGDVYPELATSARYAVAAEGLGTH